MADALKLDAPTENEMSDEEKVDAGANGEEPEAVEVPPTEFPYDAVPIPGSKWADGSDVIYAKNRETGKADLFGTFILNPPLMEAVISTFGNVDEIAEKIGFAVDSVTTMRIWDRYVERMLSTGMMRAEEVANEANALIARRREFVKRNNEEHAAEQKAKDEPKAPTAQ